MWLCLCGLELCTRYSGDRVLPFQMSFVVWCSIAGISPVRWEIERWKENKREFKKKKEMPEKVGMGKMTWFIPKRKLILSRHHWQIEKKCIEWIRIRQVNRWECVKGWFVWLIKKKHRHLVNLSNWCNNLVFLLSKKTIYQSYQLIPGTNRIRFAFRWSIIQRTKSFEIDKTQNALWENCIVMKNTTCFFCSYLNLTKPIQTYSISYSFFVCFWHNYRFLPMNRNAFFLFR